MFPKTASAPTLRHCIGERRSTISAHLVYPPAGSHAVGRFDSAKFKWLLADCAQVQLPGNIRGEQCQGRACHAILYSRRKGHQKNVHSIYETLGGLHDVSKFIYGSSRAASQSSPINAASQCVPWESLRHRLTFGPGSIHIHPMYPWFHIQIVCWPIWGSGPWDQRGLIDLFEGCHFCHCISCFCVETKRSLLS